MSRGIPLPMTERTGLQPVIAALLICLITCGCGGPPTSIEQFNGKTVARDKSDAKQANQSTPIESLHFFRSLEEAQTKAASEGKRLLVYFTGPSCGWCRMMEKEVFQNPSVGDLMRRFVLVKIDIADQPLAQEEFRAYSIPRSLVLTETFEPVGLQIGFQEAESYCGFLREGASQPTKSWKSLFAEAETRQGNRFAASTNEPPPAVGATREDADVVFWFVEQDMEQFGNGNWAEHSRLLDGLSQSGFTTRIEHIWRWDLAERWEQASAGGTRPDFLVVGSRSGFVRKLLAGDELIDIISQRLTAPLPLAMCNDFANRSVFAVRNQGRLHRAIEAADCFTSAAIDVSFELKAKLKNVDIGHVKSLVEHAAIAWHTGDVSALRPYWGKLALQDRVTDESSEMQGRRDYSEMSVPEVRLFGNSRFLFALAEMHGRGKIQKRPWFVASEQILRSPVLLALHRDDRAWKILAIGILQYDFIVDDVATLYSFDWTRANEAGLPPFVSIVAPVNGAVISDPNTPVKWTTSSFDTGPLLRLLVRSWDSHPGLPAIGLTVLPTDINSGEVQPASLGTKTRATIWSVGAAGRAAFSPVMTWSSAPSEGPQVSNEGSIR